LEFLCKRESGRTAFLAASAHLGAKPERLRKGGGYRGRTPVSKPPRYSACPVGASSLKASKEWASAGEGRSFEVDHEIDPVRRTAQADYIVSAANEGDAERAALEMFASEQVDAGIAGPETVLAEVMTLPDA